MLQRLRLLRVGRVDPDHHECLRGRQRHRVRRRRAAVLWQRRVHRIVVVLRRGPMRRDGNGVRRHAGHLLEWKLLDGRRR